MFRWSILFVLNILFIYLAYKATTFSLVSSERTQLIIDESKAKYLALEIFRSFLLAILFVFVVIMVALRFLLKLTGRNLKKWLLIEFLYCFVVGCVIVFYKLFVILPSEGVTFY